MMNLEKSYPCRSSFIKHLCSFIFNSEECFSPAIFIYGHAGAGKTAIVKDFLRVSRKENEITYVYINCIECYTIKILLETALGELISENVQNQNFRCDSVMAFVESLRNKNVYSKGEGYVLALDNAERLRDMHANILPSLLRLQEMTGLNICVILISEIPLEKYFPKSGITEVITLYCPQYSKVETLKILITQFEFAKQMLKTHIQEEFLNHPTRKNKAELMRKTDIINALTVDIFNNYLNVFLSVFYKACRNVPELKITACKCFMTYMEPVFNESVDITDVAKLWRNIAPPLLVALSKVYIRYGKTVKNVFSIDIDDKYSSQNVRKIVESLELPFYGKYLLIAAFLASHNSAKNDKRLFVKHHGKQRKRMYSINSKAKASEKISTSLGPKSFSIDRLLAIFYAILEEKLGITCNLLSQISTLLHLKLLGFVNGEQNVMDGSSRLQCTVGLEFILYIGKVVGFNVCQYLCDLL